MKKHTQNMTWKALTVAIAFAATPVLAQNAANEVGENAQPGGADVAVNPQEITCTVTSVTPTAMFRENDEAAWKALEEGQVLPVGTQIRTGLRDSGVQLALGPNADVSIQRLSRVTVGQLKAEGDSIRTLLAIQNGKVDFHVKHVGFENDFKVATPTGTMAVKGTEGTIIVDDQTNIEGNENNGGNAINFGQNNNGDDHNMTGNQQYDNGQVNNGENYDTGSNSNNEDNTNTGDGNGNGAGNNLPDLDSFNGNNNFNNDQQQFQNDLTNGGNDGGSGGDR